MAILDRALQQKQRQRVKALLRQGLTTRQISERLGLGQRQILRIKKQLGSENSS